MILNLAHSDKSDIKYEISRFPDGQQTLNLLGLSFGELKHESVEIKSRLNNFRDLELIICANMALRNLGCTEVHLFSPYVSGGRSDRKFQEGGINYLKQVICPIINSQKFTTVSVLDPHSDTLEACINNFIKFDNFRLVDWVIKELNIDVNDICLVSPDAGAYKKVFDLAKHLKIKKIITATKIRDIITGEIIETKIHIDRDVMDKTFIIVDDILDGGRTFIEIAKAIETTIKMTGFIHPTLVKEDKYLICTHGIFSSGYSKLNEHFKTIFTTNSVKEIGELEPDSYGNLNKTNVKQLDIF